MAGCRYDQISVIDGNVRVAYTTAKDWQVNTLFPCLDRVTGNLEVRRQAHLSGTAVLSVGS